jgi:hypothetical protein
MEQALSLLILPALIFAFALLTNLVREFRRYYFELKPNCLLTRNPVVFVTGLRSLFYFRKYWNAYPEILAEHGYQVFTMHLPWRGADRAIKLSEFLKAQGLAAKKFHFVCDEYTAEELKNVFEQSFATASVTILKEALQTTPTQKSSSYFLKLAYKIHSLIYFSSKLPSAEDLGLQYPNAKEWLLQKMQEKGEEDFLN